MKNHNDRFFGAGVAELPPEESSEKESHMEEEISLLNVPPDFEEKLKEEGARLLKAKRRIKDIRFSRPHEVKIVSNDFDVSSFRATRDELREIFEYLGYEVDEDRKGTIRVGQGFDVGDESPRRTARLRQDGKDFLFTVKGPIEKKTLNNIKARPEYEVGVTGDGLAELKTFLESAGHRLKSEVEKDRTTFLLPKELFGGDDDITVDIDAFPEYEGKQFKRAELEGDADDIERAMRFLKRNDIFDGKTSDAGQTELLRKQFDMKDSGEPLVLKFKK